MSKSEPGDGLLVHLDFDDEEKLECECERCFKKISLEEYELNDFMCEDCYQEVHTDKNGNFHDDEYFDV